MCNRLEYVAGELEQVMLLFSLPSVSVLGLNRHSKIYGYIWPKTQPEGKGDKEERILDHRQINRFLHPEDEAKIRGKKYWKDGALYIHGQDSREDVDDEARGRSRSRNGAATGSLGDLSGVRRSGRVRRVSSKIGED